jgi:hypothetical protein
MPARLGQDRAVKEWRPILIARLLGWGILLGYPAAVVAVMASVWNDPAERRAAAATMAVFLPMPLFAWRGALHPYVRADDVLLTIRNPLATHRVSFAEIEGATPGYNGVTVHRRDGTAVTAWAVQKSNLAAWRDKHTRADELCDYVNARTGGALPQAQHLRGDLH